MTDKNRENSKDDFEKSESQKKSAAFDTANAANILHLFDLHFGADKNSDPATDAENWYGQLVDDLRRSELKCDRLHAVIISGDIGNFSEKREYDAAQIFIEILWNKFSISKDRLVIIPGNHDLNRILSKKGYRLQDEEYYDGPLKDGHFIRVSTDVIRLRNDDYPLRFKYFSDFTKT